MRNIINKTKNLTSFVEALLEKDENIDDARRQTALDACGTARRMAKDIYWECDEREHPEFMAAYQLVYREAMESLRFYVRELQRPDNLGHSAKLSRRLARYMRPRKPVANGQQFHEFKRACYLASTPSVDLDEATEENPIDCTKHTLLLSEYQRILDEFGVLPNTGEMGDCNMWCVCRGPHIIND